MKKTILFILTLCFPAMAFCQDEITLYDISSEMEQYKLFSIFHDKLVYDTKDKYNIDIIYELFEKRILGENQIPFELTGFEYGFKVVERASKRRRLVKTKDNIVKNLVLPEEIIDNLSIIGKKYTSENYIEMLFKLDYPEYKGVVYKTYSVDKGKSWIMPSVAIKHNTVKLNAWDIAYSPQKKRYGVIVVLTDPEHQVYISTSSDDGLTWSYPRKRYEAIRGINFHSSAYVNEIAIIYENKQQYTGVEPGDVLMRFGDIVDILKDKFEGKLVKIATDKPKSYWNVKMVSKKTLFFININEVDSRISVDGYLIKINDIK